LCAAPFLCVLSLPPPRSTLFPYTTLFRSARPSPDDLATTLGAAEATILRLGGGPLAALGTLNLRRAMASTDIEMTWRWTTRDGRSEEHTSELQSLAYLVCRLLLEKKKETN